MPFLILRLQFSIILETWFKLAEVSMKIRYGTIDDAAMLAEYVLTVYGVGYKFADK